MTSKIPRPNRKFKYQRGQYCGLLSCKFIAEMFGMEFWPTYRLLSQWMHENDKTPIELRPRDLGLLFEYLLKCRTISQSPLDHLEL